jgi:glycerate kinase
MDDLTVLLSPDSLKGSLGATDAARALAEGFRRARPGVTAIPMPLSDGGEGLVDILRHALGGELRDATVSDPLGRPVDARYLVLDDGSAIMESAEPIGLTRLTPDELDPFAASSRGLGELIAAAVTGGGIREIVLGVGGVATVDGGAGLREILDKLPVPVRVASDVHNPLLGPRGAAAVFGPQKGARPADIPRLEARLASMGFAPEITRRPGAGAAGGLGAMLLSMGAEITSGIELVLDLTGWHDAVRRADLVVTGEGCVDLSSTEGKVVSGVCAAADASGVPAVVFGGLVQPDGADRLREAGAIGVIPLSGRPTHAAADLTDLGSTLAHLTNVRIGTATR